MYKCAMLTITTDYDYYYYYIIIYYIIYYISIFNVALIASAISKTTGLLTAHTRASAWSAVNPDTLGEDRAQQGPPK
jgi:hypothetical protein